MSQVSPPLSQETFEQLQLCLNQASQLEPEFTQILEKSEFQYSDTDSDKSNTTIAVERINIGPGLHPTIDNQFTDASPAIPSNDNWPGEYGFELTVEQPQQANTSKFWTYSETLKKLYIDRKVTCPFKYRTERCVPDLCYLRATALFSKLEHMNNIVVRCPNHRLEDMESDDPYAEHFLRCEHHAAKYSTDVKTGRYSVTMPYETPDPGTTWNKHFMKFMCLTSCIGGLNRRPTQVIFTLETNGVVIGRRVVDVRVCACPGRDRQNEEKRDGTRGPKITKKRHLQLKSEITTMKKSTKFQRPDDEMFVLHVKGRENYEILKRMKESLELAAEVPLERVLKYRSEQEQLHNSQPQVKSSSFTPKNNTHREDNSLVHHHETSPPANTNTLNTFTVESWLQSLALPNVKEKFHNMGMYNMSHVENINQEKLHRMGLQSNECDAVWKALIKYRARSTQRGQQSPNTPVDPSNFLEVTRYTFKRSYSCNDHDYAQSNQIQKKCKKELNDSD